MRETLRPNNVFQRENASRRECRVISRTQKSYKMLKKCAQQSKIL